MAPPFPAPTLRHARRALSKLIDATSAIEEQLLRRTFPMSVAAANSSAILNTLKLSSKRGKWSWQQEDLQMTRRAGSYGISTVNSPGVTKLITPPQMHVSVETLSRAGALPSSTFGAPGTQGAGVTGMHGMGVSTPIAAEVAAATVGLDGDMHIPKGIMFVIGM
jgi:hypothetical protein